MIKIEEKIAKKVPGITSLFLEFKYHPSIVEVIKSCDGANWDNKTKQWEVPILSLPVLIDHLSIIDEIDLHLLKDKPIKDVKYEQDPNDWYNLFEYQREGVEFGLSRDKWLLLDAPGLGKSLQIIKLAEELNREISTKLVDLAEMGASKGKVATWVKNSNYQVGLEVQHQHSLDFAIVDMEGEIFDKADRGNVTTLVGSRKGVLEPYKIIPFKDRTEIPAQQGTSLVGTYGNKPLIRAASLEDGDVDDPNVVGKLLGIYRGQYPWDAALVIGVHMPIISIKDIPNADKILMTKQGIATWSAFELISDAFVSKCNILNSEATPST